MDTFQVDDNYVKSTAYKRWGISMKKTGQAEWHSECPVCGGKDRFWVNKIGHYQCRGCDLSGWLDDDQKFRPDPLIQQHRAEWEQKEKEEAYQRWQDWTNGFLAGYYWKEWHDRMSVSNRDWWHKQGITDYMIDYYELGYMDKKEVMTDDGKITLPAYTIPIRNPQDWEICNMHYRLVDPPDGVQKYRYEHGIPAREFYAEPGVGQNSAIVVEGAKKAMVVYDRIEGKCQVVGLTSCSPSREMMDRMSLFPQVFLALDPGVKKQEERFRGAVPQSRVVRLPDKVDDLFIAGMTVNQFREYLRQSR